MATTPTTLAQMQAMFASRFYNPAGRFNTPADIVNYLQDAASETANRIGGIRVIDTSTVTVAGQSAYTLDNAIRRIVEAQYRQSPANAGNASGTQMEMDLMTQKDEAFLNQLSWPYSQSDPSPWGLVVTGNPQPVSKYCVFFPTLNQIILLDPPANGGDTIWLDCLEIPNNLTGSVQYNGDNAEMSAIVWKAVAMAWFKRGESQMASACDAKWDAACTDIRRLRSMMRQRRQAGDGRFSTTRLKSVNGAV